LLLCTKKDDNEEEAALIIKNRCQKEFEKIRENSEAMRCLGGRLFMLPVCKMVFILK
jgi:hypothetical protein